MDIPVATIPRQLSHGEELVVLRRKDFEEFQKWNQEVGDTLKKVERGRKEYREGKTAIVASSKSLR